VYIASFYLVIKISPPFSHFLFFKLKTFKFNLFFIYQIILSFVKKKIKIKNIKKSNNIYRLSPFLIKKTPSAFLLGGAK